MQKTSTPIQRVKPVSIERKSKTKKYTYVDENSKNRVEDARKSRFLFAKMTLIDQASLVFVIVSIAIAISQHQLRQQKSNNYVVLDVLAFICTIMLSNVINRNISPPCNNKTIHKCSTPQGIEGNITIR